MLNTNESNNDVGDLTSIISGINNEVNFGADNVVENNIS